MTTLESSMTTSRLLGNLGEQGTSLAQHHEIHGRLPKSKGWTREERDRIRVEIERSGLTGRGGAGFPAFRKWHSVTAVDAHPVLVVNAMEGEPASAKDRVLVQVSPHLVLDGAEILAHLLFASKIVFCVPNHRNALIRQVLRAVAERAAAAPSAIPVEVARLCGRYIAGEESALVAAAAKGAGLPAYRPDKTVPLQLGRHAALVHNVETLANVALIARYGAEWFRQLGTAEAPGTCLVTVSGGVERPGVLEVEIGTPIEQIIDRASPNPGLQASLVGGYGGSWLSGSEMATPYSPAALKLLNASMGAGVLVALPSDACGLRETARIVRFMAAESAGQCGPCLFGLPALAEDLRLIADGRADQQTLDRLLVRCSQVSGRGACRHPDGVVRLVESAVRVFALDLAVHLAGRPCSASKRATVLSFSNLTSQRSE